jgi:cobalt-zinc-cadmium efflux system membrane fusion protein
MRWGRLAALALLPLAAWPAGCGGVSREQESGAPKERTPRPSLFKVAASQLPHLRIVRAARASLPIDLTTTGTVDWDADHTTQAIAQVSGPIARIAVDLGTRVKEGDPLLYVSSPDLANAISAYRKAQNRLDQARRALDRSRDLLDHRAIAQKDFESAQADFNDATTEVENDLQALKILGVSKAELDEAQRQDGAISPRLAVRSPIAGLVVQKLVLPGQLVQAGTTQCFVISETSTVWVQGHLDEGQLASVRIGDRVEVRGSARPDAFEGRVTNIGSMLDPATRTTPIRIVTANRAGLLKKDQFVEVVVHTGTRRDATVVPTSAVLYNTENLPFVYVEVEPGGFAQRLVKLGVQHDDSVEVLSGLKDGEPVVAEGSVFLQFAETYQR